MTSSSDVIKKQWSTHEGLSKLELDFLRSLNAQGENQSRRGRAAVVDFSVENTSIQEFTTPEEFQSFLKSKIRERNPKGRKIQSQTGRASGLWPGLKDTGHYSAITHRTLIILEDISRAWIEAAWPELDIPVSVFALHWASPIAHTSGEVRVPLGESPDRHFILNYRDSLPITIEDRGDVTNDFGRDRYLEYRLGCNAIRPITSRSKEYSGPETSEQLVSYWAPTLSAHDINSPIALLLVDPALRDLVNVRKVASSSGLEDEEEDCGRALCDYYTGFIPASPVLSRIDDFVPSKQRKEHDSTPDTSLEPVLETPFLMKRSLYGPTLFDELLLPDFGYATSQPSSLSYRCRRLVLARNAGSINSALQETLKLTADASIGVNNIADFNFEDFEQRAWVDKWRGDFFTQLWALREDLEDQGYKLKQNIKIVERVVGINRTPGTRHLLRHVDQFGKDYESDHTDYLAERAVQQEEDDLFEWEYLEELRKHTFAIMERTTDSYLQTVQATGAQFANLQAKRLATLFVPASLCAAVLAIPNFGGTNENEKFWIFWAVSVPLALFLIFLFFHPVKLAKNQWASYMKSRKGDSAPAYLRRNDTEEVGKESFALRRRLGNSPKTPEPSSMA